MDAYWHEGPEVSVNAICQRAGISKPSLYRSFGSEDGLTAAALEQYADFVLSQTRTILESDVSFRDKLNALVAYASEDPCNDRGCLFVKMRTARSHLGPKTQSKVQEVDDQTLALYKQFLKDSRVAGDWGGPISPELGARFLLGQIELALSQRARGVEARDVRPLLELAVSVLDR
ncbi:MAG: TetR/AcrR family transcriptional regulator [Burkholderiales bacterium]|nr:TetR/AcrR family transcriptional regulator [Burkholderiales bacterium]